MANIKEIKNRISSVKDTAKITNAMYLIASTKLRKAKLGFMENQPYFAFLKSEGEKILEHINHIESKYFLPEGILEDEHEYLIDGKSAVLSITADKGLAGAYNQNVIKETIKILDSHPNYDLYVVGNYGKTFFSSHGYDIEESFIYKAKEPNIDEAREITNILLEKYDEKEISQIYIVYTEFDGAISTKTKSFRVLPFHRSILKSESDFETEQYFEIVPSANEVLDIIARNFVLGFIYSGIIDSYCAEQNARMMAMDSANDNAEELIDELNLEYNHARQSLITREITEISSGAKSLKQLKEALN